MKYLSVSVIALATVLAPFSALAQAERVGATVVPSGREVMVPAHAIEVAPNVFSLGETIDVESGKRVEGYMIVHKAKDKENGAKPSGTPGGSKGGTQCYGFIANGAKWKTLEPWVMNATNGDGLDGGTLFSVMEGAIAEWESAVDGVLGGGSMDIIGTGATTGDALVADKTTTDGKNEVYFGDLTDAGAIGVTTVWGVFGGPTQNRQLVEWDQVYNTNYVWSLTGEGGKMDFDNIATHELGHTFGLADLYTSACADETMYGYGVEGETKKRSLNAGDVLGISTLY